MPNYAFSVDDQTPNIVDRPTETWTLDVLNINQELRTLKNCSTHQNTTWTACDSAESRTRSRNYKQRLTWELSWCTDAEPEPLNQSQELLSIYKRLVQNETKGMNNRLNLNTSDDIRNHTHIQYSLHPRLHTKLEAFFEQLIYTHGVTNQTENSLVCECR